MSEQFINSGADIDVGVLEETTPGVFETSGPFELLLTLGSTPNFPSEMVASEEVGDLGGPRGRRTVSRGGDIDFPMRFRYDGSKTLEAHAFRDDWATEVTITGTSDIDYLTAGTHNDGSTGPQIRTGTGGFNSLITYGGATVNGAAGLTLLVEGFVSAADNQPVLIKEVWDDATNGFIDIYPGYAAGGASAVFGATKVGETGVSAILHAGEALRNKRKGSPGKRTLSVLIDRFLHETAGRFGGLVGWVANDLNLEISGKGQVNITVTGNGREWLDYSMTPQNGQAIGSHFTDTTSPEDFFIGAEDLQFLSIVTYANAINPTPDVLNLSDANVSSFTWNLAGNVNVIGDIVGTSSVLPRRGLPDFTGNFGYYIPDSTLLTKIQALGSKNNHQKAAIHALFMDPNGNWKGLTLPRNEFEQTGGEGGGDGEESGTLNFGTEAVNSAVRAAILQQWTAF